MALSELNETKICIRPIRPDDGERLRASHARLSPESRYRRFLAAKPQLSTADTRYLVEIDGCDHFALVATIQDDDGEAIVGVARFVRIPDVPDAAEFAIVVSDAFQRRGLATELLDRLAQAGTERGIARFRAVMLADNLPVRRLMERLATGPLREQRTGAISEIEIDLPRDGEARRRPAPAMIAGCAGS